MIKNISIGIDVGSWTTRVVVGEFEKGERNPKIIGVGESETKGVRHGYVVNSELATLSIRNAVKSAEQSSNIKIKRAFVSISGATLRSEISSGEAIISKADGEVTSLDVNKALEDCEDNLNTTNKKIIQVYPISYRLDGKEVLGRLEGMRGTKLEVKALFVTYSIQHLEDLISCLADAGIETIDVVPASIATSNLVLTEKQKIVGVALVDIGAETTSLTVFENGKAIFIYTFPIGSTDITNDIALGFKIPLEKAESLKRGELDENFSKKKLDEFTEARLGDIFELIENSLKKIKRAELLPAGIIFSGGGANTHHLEEFSKYVLRLPSGLGSTEIFGNTKTKLRDPSWFAVLGLVMTSHDTVNYESGSFALLLKEVKNTIKSTLKQLMP